MKNYYLNRVPQSNGDHEIHSEGCYYMPSPINRIYLGSFSSSKEALRVAKAHYPEADGCFYCCPEIHKS